MLKNFFLAVLATFFYVTVSSAQERPSYCNPRGSGVVEKYGPCARVDVPPAVARLGFADPYDLLGAIACDVGNAARYSQGRIPPEALPIDITLSIKRVQVQDSSLGGGFVIPYAGITIVPSGGVGIGSSIDNGETFPIAGRTTTDLVEHCQFSNGVRKASSSAWLRVFRQRVASSRRFKGIGRAKISQEFTMTNSSNAGLKLSFLVVSIDASTKSSDARTQTLEITYGPPAPKN